MAIVSEDFRDLIGEDLSGVTFVRDYLQLEFNPPPRLSAFTPVTVRAGFDTAKLGDPGFANLLIAQINKYVKAVELQPLNALTITFDDDSIIAISLIPDDYVGPEALTFARRDKQLLVL